MTLPTKEAVSGNGVKPRAALCSAWEESKQRKSPKEAPKSKLKAGSCL